MTTTFYTWTFRVLLGVLLALVGITARAQTGVTIGATTAPDVSAALDIIGTGKGVLLPRVAAATSVATPATGLIVFQTNSPAGYYYNAGTSTVPSWQQLATAAGAAVTASNGLSKTGQSLALGGALTGATAVPLAGFNLTFPGAGNVGIGGSGVPATTLDVTGTVLARSSMVADGAGGNTGTTASILRFGGLGSSEGIGSKRSATGNLNGLDFYTNAANRLAITNGGNVGIGTSSPAQRLDVTGGSIQISTAGQGLVFPDGTTQTTAATSATASNGLTKTGQNVALGGPLTTPTTIAQAGNNLALTGGSVGIGTAAPQTTLDVSGDFRVSTGTVNSTLGTTGTGNANISAGAIGQSFVLPVAASVTSIRLVCGATGFNTTFQIHSGSGNGGTAQLATAQAISFVANQSSTVVLPTPLPLAAGTYTLVVGVGSNPIRYFNGGENYTGGGVYSGASSFGVVDLDFTVAYTSGTASSALAVSSGGNVGIGTTGTPTALLDVNGSTRLRGLATAGVVTTDASGNLASSTATAAFGPSFIQNTTAQQASSAFNVSGTGTVGGLLSTGAGLVVNSGGTNTGSIANGLRFNGPGAGEGIASKTNAGGNQSGLDFYTNSDSKLSITNGGNVGIGTGATLPAKRLHVNAGNDVLRFDNLAQVSASNNYLVIDNSGNVGKTTVENVAGQVIRLGFNASNYFENTSNPALAEAALRFDANASAALMGSAPNGAPNFINTITGSSIATGQAVAANAANGTPARTTDQITLPAGVYRVTVRLNGAYFVNAAAGTVRSGFVKFIVNNNEYSLVETLNAYDNGITIHSEVSDYLNLTGAASTVDFSVRFLRNFSLIDRLSPGTGNSYRSLLLIERVR